MLLWETVYVCVSEFRALVGLKGGEAMMVRRYFEKCPPTCRGGCPKR